MKTLKILALALLFTGAHWVATANNYTTTKEVSGNANGKLVIYQCYVRAMGVFLYNAASARYLVNREHRNYTMKNGSPIPYNADGIVESMDDDLFIKEQKKAKYIVASGFSTTEKTLIKGHELHVSMAVTSDGKVSEVRFLFHKTSPYQQISVSTFARIEASLKQQLYYHKTALGKNMNYDIVSWSYDFTYTVANPSPTPPPSGE